MTIMTAQIDFTNITIPRNDGRPFSEAQMHSARRILYRDGWDYVEDRAFPVADPRRMGWWIHPAHPDKCRRVGDSKSFSHATETTYRLYSGHSDEEL